MAEGSTASGGFLRTRGSTPTPARFGRESVLVKPGQASQTAVRVCMGRAVAHGTTCVSRFSDPTALTLLPDDARARVERVRSKAPPRGFRMGYERSQLRWLSNMMVARTVEIDDAV